MVDAYEPVQLSPDALRDGLMRLAGRHSVSELSVDKRDFERAMDIARGAIADSKGASEAVQAELANRVLTQLALKPISSAFVREVFKGNMFDATSFAEGVSKFRTLAMWNFGSYRFAFKKLRDADEEELQTLLRALFPTPFEVNGRREILGARPSIGIELVEGHNLWALGYIASSIRERVNATRKTLLPLIMESIRKGDTTSSDFLRRHDLRDKAISDAAFSVDLLYSGTGESPFQDRLKQALKECDEVTDKKLDEIEAKARNNTARYLSTRDFDVYVATSMRTPRDFAMQAKLIDEVFNKEPIKSLNLRFFDPTQAHSHDRLDKGIMEFLTVLRSKVVLYNAQESDTFGKDAEACFALALGHSVIVHVARFFASAPAFRSIYEVVDQNRGRSIDALVAAIRARRLVLDEEVKSLAESPSDVALFQAFLNKATSPHLNAMRPAELIGELSALGYEYKSIDEFARPLDESQKDTLETKYKDYLVEQVRSAILKLETRAYTFAETHPLSLQASPIDGVARGVIVTRDPEEARHVLSAALLGNLDLEEKELDRTFILFEKTTHSPVRVVSRDEVLTTAFWATFAEVREDLRRKLDAHRGD